MAKYHKLADGEVRERSRQLRALQGLFLADKVARSQALIGEALAKGRAAVLWSGGKDSTVLLHLVRQAQPGVLVVYNDTGVEYPETRRFVRETAEAWRLNLHVAKPQPGVSFWWAIEKYGYPLLGKGVRRTGPQRHIFHASVRTRKAAEVAALSSYCCDWLKERPTARLIRGLGVEVQILGTMVSESRQRWFAWVDYGELHFGKEARTWRATPLFFWRDEDIWEYHREFGLPHCRLYDMGHKRNGCWPCVPADTLVLTPAGWVPVASCRQVQLNGASYKVGALLRQGVLPTLRVTTECGYELRGTPEHRILVMDKDGNHTFRGLSQLQPRDYVAIHRGNEQAIPHWKGELWGLLVGDGTATGNALGLAVCSQDPDLFSYAARLLQRMWKLPVAVYCHQGAWQLRIHRSSISKKVRGLIYGQDGEKRTPSFIYAAPASMVVGYLRGLFEADGTAHGGLPRLTSKSESVARGAQLLFLRIGIVTHLWQDRRGFFNLAPLGTDSLNRFWEIVGFLSQRKSAQRLRAKTNQPGARDIIPFQANNLRQVAAHLPSLRQSPVRHLLQARFTDRSLSWSGFHRVYEEFASFLQGAQPLPDLLPALEPLREIHERHYFYDRVNAVIPSPDIEVFDLSVPQLEAYCTQGFISHNCGMDWAFPHGNLAALRLSHPRMWHFLMVEKGVGEMLLRIKLNLRDGQMDLFQDGKIEAILESRPCYFDSLEGL
jgi:3'-phosphoadenosine 5'-phosphosulfate sulfotransferase (PAPS reductase)/FAD synthetase